MGSVRKRLTVGKQLLYCFGYPEGGRSFLDRNAERLEADITHLTKKQVEIDAKQAEIKNFEEKEKHVMFLRNHFFNNVSAQLSERFREEISLRGQSVAVVNALI